MARMTKAEKAEQAEAIEHLRKMLKPGDTVYCVLRSVSRSETSRVIDFYKIEGGDALWLTGLMARAGLGTRTKSGQAEGLKVEGGGMDMGFHVVYALGRTLFPEGFGILPSEQPRMDLRPLGVERPETREEAADMVANGHKFYGDESGWDNDGGYALKYRWL